MPLSQSGHLRDALLMPTPVGGVLITVSLLLAAACAGPRQQLQATDELDRYQKGLALVTAAREAIGSLDTGWQVRLSGERDLAARWQGRDPFSSEPTRIDETISYDAQTGRTAYEVDGFNYFSSRQHLREVYDARGLALYVDRRNANAGWSPFFTPPGVALRYRRVLPQVVVAEALQRRASLRWLGTDARGHEVAYSTADGERISLILDRITGRPVSATTLLDMELVGDSTFSWHWSEWVTGAMGLPYPSRLETRLNGAALKDTALDLLVGTPVDSAFQIPDGISAPPPPEDLRQTPPTPPSQRPPEIEAIAPGVYFLRNLRPGFHSLFVAFDSFALVVDAPTGWFETQQLPPRNFVSGETGRSLSRKFLEAIRQTLPDKPLRYVALTHHHSDHIGGLRVFRDAGATLLASETTGAAVRQALHRPDTLGEAGDATALPLRLETYSGQWLLEDSTQSVMLIELPADNPKARGFSLIYLPRQKIGFLAGFIYPVPESVFPLRESIPLSTWFVDWLDQSGLQIERLYNVHAGGLVAQWQLDQLRRLAARKGASE